MLGSETDLGYFAAIYLEVCVWMGQGTAKFVSEVPNLSVKTSSRI